MTSPAVQSRTGRGVLAVVGALVAAAFVAVNLLAPSAYRATTNTHTSSDERTLTITLTFPQPLTYNDVFVHASYHGNRLDRNFDGNTWVATIAPYDGSRVTATIGLAGHAAPVEGKPLRCLVVDSAHPDRPSENTGAWSAACFYPNT